MGPCDTPGFTQVPNGDAADKPDPTELPDSSPRSLQEVASDLAAWTSFSAFRHRTA